MAPSSPDSTGSSTADTVPGTAWRWPLRSWIKQSLAAFVVLALWNFFREDDWHAELAVANYDCRQGEVCKLRPGLAVEASDGHGHIHRYTTNHDGFRSPDFPPVAHDPSVIRIEVFGSSPIFGLGVDDGDTLPELLQQELTKVAPGRRIEVMNFGLPMNYFSSELTTYSAFGRAFQPDLVVFVQPEIERTLDMNPRLLQLERSPSLRALLPYAPGRILVNRFQYMSMEFTNQMTKALTPARLRAKAQVLLEDQVARGTRVYFFDLFDELDHVNLVLPSGLRYGVSSSGLTHPEYLTSPDVIPHDGHPNARGQHHFAAMLAPRLVPYLPL